MKKALLITLEYPPQNGGIARYLYNIYSSCSRDQLVILAPHAKSENAFDKEQAHKIYRRMMSVWWAWPHWRIIGWHVISIWLRERFNEIHISHVLPVGYIAFIFWKIFKIPYRVYTHGMDILLPQESVWKKFWLKVILRNAREVIANSNFTKNEISKLGIDAKKVTVRYPCVFMPKLFSYSHELENSFRSKHELFNRKIILSVGRLVPRKGFDKVIEAMPKVLQEVPDAVYVIVGDGLDFNRLELTVAALAGSRLSGTYSLSPRSGIPFAGQLKDQIIFIQGASEAELSAWYSLCDLFAMPARQIGGDVEGFGIVFLEAALHGKPSLGSRSGGIPEAIEDERTGILVDPENVDEIAKTLVKLLKDEALRVNMGKAAETRVKEQFLCRTGNQNSPEQ